MARQTQWPDWTTQWSQWDPLPYFSLWLVHVSLYYWVTYVDQSENLTQNPSTQSVWPGDNSNTCQLLIGWHMLASSPDLPNASDVTSICISTLMCLLLRWPMVQCHVASRQLILPLSWWSNETALLFFLYPAHVPMNLDCWSGWSTAQIFLPSRKTDLPLHFFIMSCMSVREVTKISPLKQHHFEEKSSIWIAVHEQKRQSKFFFLLINIDTNQPT